jgi:hypothetical protein
MMKPKCPQSKISAFIARFEKGYFPASFKERIEKEESQEPGAFGKKLAAEFLERVRKQLAEYRHQYLHSLTPR